MITSYTAEKPAATQEDGCIAGRRKYNIWYEKLYRTGPHTFAIQCANLTTNAFSKYRSANNLDIQIPRLACPGAVDPMYFSSFPLMLNCSVSSFGAFLSPIIPAFSHLLPPHLLQLSPIIPAFS